MHICLCESVYVRKTLIIEEIKKGKSNRGLSNRLCSPMSKVFSP
jgi:hypothetical protein